MEVRGEGYRAELPRRTLFRQATYRFCAGALLYPEPARLETLASGSQWLVSQLGDDPALSGFATPLREDARALQQWSTEVGRDLETSRSEWVRLFGTSRHSYCFPYEGAYGPAESAGPLLAALQMEYARAGLVLNIDDLPDHISVELEYMSYLCGLEGDTLRDDEGPRRGRIVKAQRMFLEHHLSRWLPALSERVKSCEGGGFAVACHMARRLTQTDLSHLRDRALSVTH